MKPSSACVVASLPALLIACSGGPGDPPGVVISGEGAALINLPSGTTVLSQPIVLESGARLVGSNGTTLKEGSSFVGDSLVAVAGASDVTIDGVTFQLKPHGAASIAINIAGSTNVTVRNSSITGRGFVGIFSSLSTIHLLQNSWTGMFSGALLLGGTADDPASVEMVGNSGHGNVYATCIIGESGNGDETGAHTAVVTGNDFSQNGVDCNNAIPNFGGGIQVLPTTGSALQLNSTVLDLTITDNVLDGNLSYGVIIDGDHSAYPGEVFVSPDFRASVTGSILRNHAVGNSRNAVMFGMAFWATPVAQRIFASGSGACDDGCPQCIDKYRETPYYQGARYDVTFDGAPATLDFDNPAGGGNVIRINGSSSDWSGTRISGR
jgi:hypothetical protein